MNQEATSIKNIRAMFFDPNHKFAHFIDGSFSGFFASLLIQPFQVIKTAMMVKPVSQNKI